MAELYDWAKEEQPKSQIRVVALSGVKGEYTFNIKRIEIPGQDDKIILGSLESDRKYQALLDQKENDLPRKKYSLVGSITEALTRALNKNPKRRLTLIPDTYGRLYFTNEGIRYYISSDRTSCLDESGKIWMIDPETLQLYGGIEETLSFDYAFLTPEEEDAYYKRKTSEEIYNSLFSDSPTVHSPTKVVDFASYQKQSDNLKR